MAASMKTTPSTGRFCRHTPRPAPTITCSANACAPGGDGFAEIFDKADVILTPGTALPVRKAPPEQRLVRPWV